MRFAAEYYTLSKSERTSHPLTKGKLVFNEIADGRRVEIATVYVAGKAEARQEAYKRNAECWNF